MNVAIIGAGIVGVTTAYELAADGHAVTVFERHGSVAAEASFADAGLVAPGCVTPWAAPGLPGRLLAPWLGRHAALRVRPGVGAAACLWSGWRASRARTWRNNRLRMQRLAQFSLDRLHRITGDLKLDYERNDGCLVLLRTPRDLALAQRGLGSLTRLNIRFETLDATQCAAVEPGLSLETPLCAGIHLPDDEVGNCREFAHLLRTEAQRLGARFRFHNPVQKIMAGRAPQLIYQHAPPDDSAPLKARDKHPSSEARDTQPLAPDAVTADFDAIVVCAGLGAAKLLRPLGLRLPLYPVFGYSVTAPLRPHEGHPDPGPRSALVDERSQVVISRLGARVRVTGGAEIGGSLARHSEAPLAALYKVLHDWFPGRALLAQAQTWKGAHAVLPDGPPVLGRSGVDGVWLNLGHGANAWALACGSARLLAHAMAGRAAVIDTEGLGIERLRR